MPRYGSDKQAVPSKVAVDAALQTDSMERKEESCQTDGPESTNFQVQATRSTNFNSNRQFNQM